jgi:glycosyltransferase involved in cell wall biosynthesis
MVAFHYPPASYSSGLQRTLKFSQYLGEFGWRPIVLTAHPRAHRATREDQLRDIPEGVVVKKAFALDASRHLKFFGRYPRFSALPDPWASWWLGAVVAGRMLLREFRPDLIWSTYPIATAHLIADSLRKVSGLPWVADFRDPMVEGHYPPDERQREAYESIEGRTMTRSSRAVFTTEGARKLYSSRYPDVAGSLAVIPNGFDEESFVDAERMESLRERAPDRPLVLVHSGALYPSERDPRSFYAAIATLAREGSISPRTLRVVLRAPGFVDHHRKVIDSFGIGEIVSLGRGLPYRAALREMLDADGLLLFQASNCNHQVPAKLYEYLRAKRPILALTDPAGDTAEALRKGGFRSIVPLDDERRIARALLEFMVDIRLGRAPVGDDKEIHSHSRRCRTEVLAKLFEEVITPRPSGTSKLGES